MSAFTAPKDMRPKEYKRIPRKLKKRLKKQFPRVMSDPNHSWGVKLWYAQSYNNELYHRFFITTLCEINGSEDYIEVNSEAWKMYTDNGKRDMPQFLIYKDITHGRVVYRDDIYAQIFRVSETKYVIKYRENVRDSKQRIKLSM